MVGAKLSAQPALGELIQDPDFRNAKQSLEGGVKLHFLAHHMSSEKF